MLKKRNLFIIVSILLFVIAIVGITYIISKKGNTEHNHSFSNEWSYNVTHHWQACSKCNEVRNKAEHDWNVGIVTIAPTETTDGVRTFTCNTCKHTKVEPISALEHRHTFETDFSSDIDYHWYACSGCDEVKDKAQHSWNEGIITKEATDSETGLIVYTCTICKRTKTEEIPLLTHIHSYEDGWTSDEIYHWHASTCGHKSEISDKAEHSWNEGIITKNASETEIGIKTYTCVICDKTKSEIIPKLVHTHTYSSEWSYNDNYHWHAATCEHNLIKNDESYHDWIDTGMVITEATETVEGEKEQKCSQCECVRIVKTGKLGHVHTFSNIWSYDNDYHWYSATCGHTDITSNKVRHNWDNGNITKESTIYDEGIKTYTCLICDAIKEETIPELDSFTIVFIDNNYMIISFRNYALGTKSDDIQLPNEIMLIGYQFVCWEEVKSYTNITQFDFSEANNNDVYYFKSYYEREFNIVFKDHLGNQLAIIVKTESNNNISIEECPEIPEREGYTSYWDVKTLFNINQDMVITPIYERITFEVIFEDNEGNVLSYTDNNGNVIKKQIVDYGSFAIAPDYEPYYFNKTEMKLYEFSGWSTSFDSVKEDLVIVAQYNKIYEETVIALKISGNKISISIIFPSKDTTLYSLNLSFKWNVEVGTYNIIDSSIKSSTPLNANSHNGECTVGEKSGWLNYNNKTATFDFVWNCGYGHSFNNTHFTQDVFTLTFEIDGVENSETAIDASIFTLTDNSAIIYGGQNDDVSKLPKTKPTIWFYE